MFLRLVGVRSTEQAGIIGGKIPFDPNIIILASGFIFSKISRISLEES